MLELLDTVAHSGGSNYRDSDPINIVFYKASGKLSTNALGSKGFVVVARSRAQMVAGCALGGGKEKGTVASRRSKGSGQPKWGEGTGSPSMCPAPRRGLLIGQLPSRCSVVVYTATHRCPLPSNRPGSKTLAPTSLLVPLLCITPEPAASHSGWYTSRRRRQYLCYYYRSFSYLWTRTRIRPKYAGTSTCSLCPSPACIITTQTAK